LLGMREALIPALAAICMKSLLLMSFTASWFGG
jgi:hypothetical protein